MKNLCCSYTCAFFDIGSVVLVLCLLKINSLCQKFQLLIRSAFAINPQLALFSDGGQSPEHYSRQVGQQGRSLVIQVSLQNQPKPGIKQNQQEKESIFCCRESSDRGRVAEPGS